MQALLPELDCRSASAPGDKTEVEYALVWKPPPGWLKAFPNLRCIVSIGGAAGAATFTP